MREKLVRFMQGRYGAYGPDLLNKFLLGSALVILIISSLFGWRFLYGMAIVEIIYAYFRMFSRNVAKRYGENQFFIMRTEGIRRFIKGQKNMMKQRKTHHIYHCPGCRQKIRIPRGKGKIAIKCPKCGIEFIKRS